MEPVFTSTDQGGDSGIRGQDFSFKVGPFLALEHCSFSFSPGSSGEQAFGGGGVVQPLFPCSRTRPFSFFSPAAGSSKEVLLPGLLVLVRLFFLSRTEVNLSLLCRPGQDLPSRI